MLTEKPKIKNNETSKLSMREYVDSKAGGGFSGTMDDITDGSTYVKTHNDFTDTEQSKLSGIASGAEVNVNADWNAVSGDAQILNKPSIPAGHTQGTDQGLDTGGTNAVTAAQAKAGYTHSQATHAPTDAINELIADARYARSDYTIYGSKPSVINDDVFVYFDSENGYPIVTLTFTELLKVLKEYFDNIYTPL